MHVPSAIDVLISVENTLEKVVRPRLVGTTERSALASIGHLLRHARLRIETEGQNCLEDIADLERLLTSGRDYCRKLATPQAAACVQAIEAAINRPPRSASVYPTLERLSAEVSLLRGALQTLLDFLVSIRVQQQSSSDYQELRQGIRRQMAAEIEREAKLIDPAFDGQGPRR